MKLRCKSDIDMRYVASGGSRILCLGDNGAGTFVWGELNGD